MALMNSSSAKAWVVLDCSARLPSDAGYGRCCLIWVRGDILGSKPPLFPPCGYIPMFRAKLGCVRKPYDYCICPWAI